MTENDSHHDRGSDSRQNAYTVAALLNKGEKVSTPVLNAAEKALRPKTPKPPATPPKTKGSG